MTAHSPLVIASGEAFPIRLGFRLPVSHFLKTRQHTVNIIVRLHSANGCTGHGESVPRDYISGETPEGVLATLERLLPQVEGHAFGGPGELREALQAIGTSEPGMNHPAAVCALELAVLDLAGREWKMSAGEILALPIKKPALIYSLVVPYLTDTALTRFLENVRPFGFRHAKIKVLAEDRGERVRLVRTRLGNDIELRVDANCAWEHSDAAARMREMADLGVVSVEQPLAAGNLAGAAGLRRPGFPRVTLDESVRSTADIERIADAGAADILNIRISKCGGMLGSLKMIEAARKHGIAVQLGAHVGESCILSAAGALLASGYPEFIWLEGCFGGHLLDADLCEREFQFSEGGNFQPQDGPGLGVIIDPRRLEQAKEACSGLYEDETSSGNLSCPIGPDAKQKRRV